MAKKEFEWAVNPFKLSRAKRMALDNARVTSDVEKKPLVQPTEAEVKEIYVKLGGLVAATAIELEKAKQEGRRAAQEAQERRDELLRGQRQEDRRLNSLKSTEE